MAPIAPTHRRHDELNAKHKRIKLGFPFQMHFSFAIPQMLVEPNKTVEIQTSIRKLEISTMPATQQTNSSSPVLTPTDLPRGGQIGGPKMGCVIEAQNRDRQIGGPKMGCVIEARGRQIGGPKLGCAIS
ncbi:hypothetical protein DFH28DRAFT_1217884 [Melampsora americana]|nr:hypothetical protein DFH28DRAFT_1217884 [Melampsora americana]